jgi:AraC-like DNA-binding protein
MGHRAATLSSGTAVFLEESAMLLQSFRERLPAQGLESHLVCVWVQRVMRSSPPYAHRTVPNGSIEIVCRIGEAPEIVGLQTGTREELIPPGTDVVGVRFRPGAAPAVLGMPASEFVDVAVDADEVWGRGTVRLAEAIAGAATPEDAAATLEAEVRARLEGQSPQWRGLSLRHDAQLDPLVAKMVRRLLTARRDDVSAVASSLYVSERQLRRRCEKAVGIGPKALQRMLRFERFLALTRRHDSKRAELARLAIEAGYADQSHLSREAVRLAGRTPRALLHEAEHHCRGAHDHAASYRPLLAS